MLLNKQQAVQMIYGQGSNAGSEIPKKPSMRFRATRAVRLNPLAYPFSVVQRNRSD